MQRDRFASWRAAVGAFRQKVQGLGALHHVVLRIRMNAFQRGFMSWRLVVREGAHEQRLAVGIVARAFRKRASSQMAHAWRVLVSVTETTKGMARGVSMTHRVAKRILMSKLRAAYDTWATCTRGLVRKELLQSIASDRMIRTLRRIQISRTATCFLAWSLFAEDSRRADASQVNGAQAMIRTVRKLSSAKLSRAWQMCAGARGGGRSIGAGGGCGRMRSE